MKRQIIDFVRSLVGFPIVMGRLEGIEAALSTPAEKDARGSAADASGLNAILGANLTEIVESVREADDELAAQLAERLLFVAANAAFRTEQVKVSVFNKAEAFGAHFLPVHFYSPIPAADEVDPNVENYNYGDIPGVMPSDQSVRAAMETYKEFAAELSDVYVDRPDPLDFYWTNPAYNEMDAIGLYSTIRKLKPRRVVEIGSGYSSLIAARALEKNGSGEIICIEPYANEMLDALANRKCPSQIIAKKVQDSDKSLIPSLSEGDILFIDSSHVSKYGSDVNFEFFKLLPFVNPGVVIHIHDICLPLDFHPAYFNRKIFWNEQYLLTAFMSFNSDFKPLVSNYDLGLRPEYRSDLDQLSAAIGRPVVGGGSFWLTRRAD